IFFRDDEVRVQQFIHRTGEKPVAVQSELAAWLNQPVGDEQIQNFVPADRFAPFGQSFLPELIQTQLLPQLTGQPTDSEYTRIPQFQFPYPHLNAAYRLPP